MRSLGPIHPRFRGRVPLSRRVSILAGACALALFGAIAGPSPAELLPPTAPSRPALSATSTAGSDSSRFASGDTVEIVAHRYRLSLDQSDLSRLPFQLKPDFRFRRPVPISRVLRPRPVELTRFSCAIHGADLGAGTASSLGGLGLVTGLWGEKTTGYLMGAGAILGAIWGGTAGANDSRFRVRVGGDTSGPPASGHGTVPDERRP